MGRPELTKICSMCKKTKPLSDFYNNLTTFNVNAVTFDLRLSVNLSAFV